MDRVVAYILIKVEIGKLQNVIENLRKLDMIESVAVTTGEYDVVVRANVETLEQLYELTTLKIHKIDGIADTITQVVEKEL
ncbi:MAG: Lrp/AsnC ligand binding domain-containing protein [Candidatus Odinarchaeota archaeon]|nr:Lrp/AsnC ligand binding domain-containing protein [Candidatus Odinarchaeota archaeon]